MQKRINRLNIQIKNDKGEVFKDEHIVIAIDSTGIKFTNRDQWMREMKNKKERIFEIHVAVNIKTKKILSMKGT